MGKVGKNYSKLDIGNHARAMTALQLPRPQSVFLLVQVQCCCTSIETIRTVRDGEPSTSTFTQLLMSA